MLFHDEEQNQNDIYVDALLVSWGSNEADALAGAAQLK
jgi:hypothetical protein